jgi:hypothetical protein
MTSLRSAVTSVFALTTLAATVACSDDDSSGPASRQVTLTFQPAPSTSAASASVVGDALPAATTSAAELTITRGSDVMVVSSAELVIRNIKLQPTGETCVDDSDDDVDVDDDDCATVFTGPFLADLLSTVDAESQLSVTLPEGTYRSVQFRLHKVNSNKENERAFREANPGFDGISVRVIGTFNGEPFTYTADITQNFKLDLADPLVVDAESENVAVVMDIASWFTPNSGNGLISPIGMSNQTRQAIAQNIRAGIRAFRDRNDDGQED